TSAPGTPPQRMSRESAASCTPPGSIATIIWRPTARPCWARNNRSLFLAFGTQRPMLSEAHSRRRLIEPGESLPETAFIPSPWARTLKALRPVFGACSMALRRSWSLLIVVALGFSTARAADPPRPKLAVVIVFDQMRGDYLERWAKLYGEGGFKRLEKDGV